ncbi:uncharacterized protein [Diabrotica undecimpunctata]|uniref:uncharacterized protein n=1 Tax=Diabrotica undecimpunctata TaxID=50387 RepID=UPI003B632A7E
MDNIDMELLIIMVENRPVLWDKTQECYKKKQSSFSAWREIYIALNDDFEALSEKEKNDFGRYVIKKWNNARDNWIRCHKKIKEYKSGSGVKNKQKYKFYDKMLFLTKTFSQSGNEQTNSQTYNKPHASVNTANSTETKRREKESSELDQQKVIQSIENQVTSKSMCFFKGIAPIVDKYSDEDYIEFQYEVIKTMRNLSGRKQGSHHLQQDNYSANTAATVLTSTLPWNPSTSSSYYEHQPTQQQNNESISTAYDEIKPENTEMDSLI